MTYSLDFRRKVFEVKEKEKLSYRETVRLFNLSLATLTNWTKQLIPCSTRNKPATKIDMEALKKDVEDFPDAYNHERAERLNVSTSCVFYALKRLGVSCKKKHYSTPNGMRRSVKYLKKK